MHLRPQVTLHPRPIDMEVNEQKAALTTVSLLSWKLNQRQVICKAILNFKVLNQLQPSHPIVPPAPASFAWSFGVLLATETNCLLGTLLYWAMDIAIKHCLAWTAIEDLLKYSNNLLGTDVLPDIKYLFRKISRTSPEVMNFFFYCPVCHRLLAKTGGSLEERNGRSGMCCGKRHTGRQLSSKGCFFVNLSLKKQFASVLAVDTVRQELYKFASG
ncbi:hypothetical protein HPB49_018679 [Dermacentor silvarum]|uniref:Uncharacterized protein n=1 Tax=Dermacentor silvarum TaxID=543639 RepID=A0ACB8CZ02_DERSI|nr:hypothetical protein HPB49_018679 [Dermacentor silvarum]